MGRRWNPSPNSERCRDRYGQGGRPPQRAKRRTRNRMQRVRCRERGREVDSANRRVSRRGSPVRIGNRSFGRAWQPCSSVSAAARRLHRSNSASASRLRNSYTLRPAPARPQQPNASRASRKNTRSSKPSLPVAAPRRPSGRSAASTRVFPKQTWLRQRNQWFGGQWRPLVVRYRQPGLQPLPLLYVVESKRPQSKVSLHLPERAADPFSSHDLPPPRDPTTAIIPKMPKVGMWGGMRAVRPCPYSGGVTRQDRVLRCDIWVGTTGALSRHCAC